MSRKFWARGPAGGPGQAPGVGGGDQRGWHSGAFSTRKSAESRGAGRGGICWVWRAACQKAGSGQQKGRDSFSSLRISRAGARARPRFGETVSPGGPRDGTEIETTAIFRRKTGRGLHLIDIHGAGPTLEKSDAPGAWSSQVGLSRDTAELKILGGGISLSSGNLRALQTSGTQEGGPGENQLIACLFSFQNPGNKKGGAATHSVHALGKGQGGRIPLLGLAGASRFLGGAVGKSSGPHRARHNAKMAAHGTWGPFK